MKCVLEDPRPIRLTLEPLDDFVVIEQTDEEAETRGGLIIPASAETQCRQRDRHRGRRRTWRASCPATRCSSRRTAGYEVRLAGIGGAGHPPPRADRPHPRLSRLLEDALLSGRKVEVQLLHEPVLPVDREVRAAVRHP